MIIDGHPVLTEFTSAEADQGVIKKPEEWKSKHVRESQYFLQIVKCKDSKCCSPLHSSCLKWVKWDVDAHYLFLTQNLALKAQLAVTALKNFLKGIPCDYSCPAAQNITERRLRSKCRLYLPSIKEVSLHEQMHKKQKTTPSDISSEPLSKQSAETATSMPKTTTCCSSATKRTTACVPVPGIRVDGTWWCWHWRSCHTPSFIYKFWRSNHWKIRGNLERGVNFIFQYYDTVLYFFGGFHYVVLLKR